MLRSLKNKHQGQLFFQCGRWILISFDSGSNNINEASREFVFSIKTSEHKKSRLRSLILKVHVRLLSSYVYVLNTGVVSV
uniref:Ovule protein n=1 Tax=Heterorhabditis bacteriophora TaxID=37862 RepID=A0A1I7XPG1_HETBA